MCPVKQRNNVCKSNLAIRLQCFIHIGAAFVVIDKHITCQFKRQSIQYMLRLSCHDAYEGEFTEFGNLRTGNK